VDVGTDACADAGADRAGPAVGPDAYWALLSVAWQNPNASSVNNALQKGTKPLATRDSTGSSAILGPFGISRQIFKRRNKS
jgi:hypothetical protein